MICGAYEAGSTASALTDFMRELHWPNDVDESDQKS
jgi:hypothetical protein